MTSRNILPTVIKDLFKQQFKWTMAFIGILLVINIFKIGQAIFQDKGVDDYFSTGLIAANIYMFVIGILCVFFLKYFVEHGVTRQAYFKGAFIVAIMLAVIIPIITFIIYKIQMIAFGNTINFNESTINEVVTDIDKKTSIVDDIVVALVTAPHIDPNEQTFLALGIFSLNLLFYFLAGWLISTGFQYPVPIGLIITALTAGVIALQDALVRVFLGIPILPRFEFMAGASKSIVLIGLFAFIIGISLAIQQLIKKAVVKL